MTLRVSVVSGPWSVAAVARPLPHQRALTANSTLRMSVVSCSGRSAARAGDTEGSNSAQVMAAESFRQKDAFFEQLVPEPNKMIENDLPR